MSDDIARIEERALELLRIGYLEALNSDADLATVEHCAPQLGLDPEDDQGEFIRLASYLDGRRYIEQYASGFSMFTITPSGRELVEGEAPQPAQQVSTHDYTIREMPIARLWASSRPSASTFPSTCVASKSP